MGKRTSIPWHSMSVEATLDLLGSSEEGLSDLLAISLQQHYGINELPIPKKRSLARLFLEKFNDFMILVLFLAAIIAGLAGDWIDTIIIIAILLINAVMGFLQEYKAQQALDALKNWSPQQAKVKRSGQWSLVEATALVPGDWVSIEAGTRVPADIRLIEAHLLLVDESMLTGESMPVMKSAQPMPDTPMLPGEILNHVFMGSFVARGRAEGVVVHTGVKTQMGRIANMLHQKEPPTPLQLRMNDFGKKISYAVILLCVLLFGIGLLRGENMLVMLLTSISLAVAAIPEALPALMTIALARGAKRLVKKHVLIRKLQAVETLGSVRYLCTDKTGTLTQHRMSVVKSWAVPTNETIEGESLLQVAMALNHDTTLSAGDPTEQALVNYIKQTVGTTTVDRWQQVWPRVAECPFDADRKCMSTLHVHGNRILVLTKGAFESLPYADSTRIAVQEAQGLVDAWAGEGIRVMAYAYRWMDAMPAEADPVLVEQSLTLLGIVGMVDPPRPEVVEAIRQSHEAGVLTVMITGDHPATAEAIAREIGILEKIRGPEDHDQLITGSTLQALSDEQLLDRVERLRVYARVGPDQKLRIVQALQQRGHFVAMTGDGVNDAPSLRAANIGIAMGISGTDVSKEVAHMTLLDDNYASIIKGIAEGRRIYDNIRKFVKYIMTCNTAEIATLLLAPFFGLPIPLLPVHILWINLVTDGLPGLALAHERPERHLMQRPPRHPRESLFSDGIGFHIIWVGLFMAAVTLGVQAWGVYYGDGHWQTMVFTVLAFSQLGHVLSIRREKRLLFRDGFFTNRPLWFTLLLTVTLQGIIIYWPVAQHIFKTQPLTLLEFIGSMIAASLVFHAVEMEKLVRYYWWDRRNS